MRCDTTEVLEASEHAFNDITARYLILLKGCGVFRLDLFGMTGWLRRDFR
jgi:hypothetical protein